MSLIDKEAEIKEKVLEIGLAEFGIDFGDWGFSNDGDLTHDKDYCYSAVIRNLAYFGASPMPQIAEFAPTYLTDNDKEKLEIDIRKAIKKLQELRNIEESLYVI